MGVEVIKSYQEMSDLGFHKVEIDMPNEDLDAWCRERLEGEFRVLSYSINRRIVAYFELASDATLFRLRWQ